MFPCISVRLSLIQPDSAYLPAKEKQPVRPWMNRERSKSGLPGEPILWCGVKSRGKGFKPEDFLEGTTGMNAGLGWN